MAIQWGRQSGEDNLSPPGEQCGALSGETYLRVCKCLKKLFNKGIVSKNEEKYRILYSPPVKLHQTDTCIVFHTGKYIPELIQDSTNSLLWTVDYTPVQFYIDSTGVKSIFGRIHIPLKKIVRDYLPDL